MALTCGLVGLMSHLTCDTADFAPPPATASYASYSFSLTSHHVSAVLMIATGAFGALTVGNVKWVWWFFGMCWFLHIIFALGKSWAEAAKAKGGESGSVYSKIAGITVITWFCYPIVWVFAEGFGNFSVTFEVCLPRLWLRTLCRVLRVHVARFFVGASAGWNGPRRPCAAASSGTTRLVEGGIRIVRVCNVERIGVFSSVLSIVLCSFCFFYIGYLYYFYYGRKWRTFVRHFRP